MKRNEFLKSIGLTSLFFLVKPAAAKDKSTKKLVQVKPFNKKTITQEIAAEIMALVAWNHLNEKRFANTFVLTQHYDLREPKRGSYMMADEQSLQQHLKDFPDHCIIEESRVKIYSPITEQYVTVWKDGDWKCSYRTDEGKHKDSEYKYIVRNVKTGHEHEEVQRDSGHGLNQAKMIDLYLRYGFYEYK